MTGAGATLPRGIGAGTCALVSARLAGSARSGHRPGLATSRREQRQRRPAQPTAPHRALRVARCPLRGPLNRSRNAPTPRARWRRRDRAFAAARAGDIDRDAVLAACHHEAVTALTDKVTHDLEVECLDPPLCALPWVVRLDVDVVDSEGHRRFLWLSLSSLSVRDQHAVRPEEAGDGLCDCTGLLDHHRMTGAGYVHNRHTVRVLAGERMTVL